MRCRVIAQFRSTGSRRQDRVSEISVDQIPVCPEFDHSSDPSFRTLWTPKQVKSSLSLETAAAVWTRASAAVTRAESVAMPAGLCPSYEFRLCVIPLADESLVSCGRWHDPQPVRHLAFHLRRPGRLAGDAFPCNDDGRPAVRHGDLPVGVHRGGSSAVFAGGLFGWRSRAFSMGSMVSTTSAPTTTLTRSKRSCCLQHFFCLDDRPRHNEIAGAALDMPRPKVEGFALFG